MVKTELIKKKLIHVVLIHGKIVDNNYQHDLKFLYAFVPNK